MSSESVNALSDEIDRLIERFRLEFELTYAEAVGVLQMKLWLLCQEAERNSDDG